MRCHTEQQQQQPANMTKWNGKTTTTTKKFPKSLYSVTDTLVDHDK